MNLLVKLGLCFKRIPKEIHDKEKIVNIVFSPLNFRANGTLLPNAYKCPKGKDDLSVNRLDYTSLDACKKQGLDLEKRGVAKMPSKKYYGIALLFAKEIREVDTADVFHRPLLFNLAHAEIETGYVAEKGIPAPAQYTYIVDQLTKKSKVFVDSDLISTKWMGEDENYIKGLTV